MTCDAVPRARESATVVLLRERDNTLQVLMLQKHAALNYGGSWVFPGGIVEPEDIEIAEKNSAIDVRTEAARVAVLRESHEETGLILEARDLQPFSNWLTPKIRAKRYNTLFFIGTLAPAAEAAEIRVDGQEIVAAQWLSPHEALAAQAAGKMILNGPSFVTLNQLKKYDLIEDARANLLRDGISYYKPRGVKTATGVATIYEGDQAYGEPELNPTLLSSSGTPHHRLYMHKDRPWEFIDSREHE